MGYNSGYEASMEELMEGLVAASSSQSLVSGLLGIASYVFVALALYTIATRRGIKKAWLAWVPVLDVWILGSISDQFRYVVKNQTKSKRKVLLTLGLISAGLVVAMVVLFVVIIVGVIVSASQQMSEMQMFDQVMGPLFGMLGVVLVALGISIAHMIVYYMALYDVYASCEPANSVLYLVLSIIPGISAIALPVLLFLCREKDGGMPPRKDEAQQPASLPEWQQESPVWRSEPETPADPWNNPANE